jgi:glycosyltransferase involved in cell wall biosynthesis
MNWLVLAESDLAQEFAMRTHVLEFCQALSKHTAVTLLTQTAAENVTEEPPFASILLSHHRSRPHNLSQILDTWSAYSKLRRLHQFQPIDMLYIRGTAFGLGPLLFARRFHVPAVLEINGAWSEEQKLSRARMPVLKRCLVAPIQLARAASLDFACHLALKIVVVTPQLAEYLQKKGIPEHKITIVPNGVNPDRFVPLSQQKARSRLGLDPAGQYIGFVGSLTAWQGLDTLIAAFANLPEPAGRRLRLLIVGEGSERKRLEDFARHAGCAERVRITGAQPYLQMPYFIAACDILVAPKRSLPSGYSTLKVLEYMACARPLVASRAPGMEIIEHARAGFLFTPEDPLDLQQKLLQIFDLPEIDRQAMGLRGRDFVVAHCTWDHTVERVLTLVTP